jgi:hypothetical protein
VDAVRKIANTLLYEGYILWPYRRSAIKNQQRWTLGGVYPRAHSEAGGGTDAWFMQTECIVVGEDPIVEVTMRFLQIVQRQVVRKEPDGSLTQVDELNAGRERYLTWDEAVEREFVAPGLCLATMSTPRRVPITITAGSSEEVLKDPSGNVVGKLIRGWDRLVGQVEISATPVDRGAFRLSAKIVNTASGEDQGRDTALRHSFISTHMTLRVSAGEFISMTDPPREWQALARTCENIKTGPVLVGAEGDRHLMLSSPIILSDYPEIAPESQGDLFDGTEIDQLLLLNVLTMTDEEKDEMRATDPRARAILERSESLTSDDFMQLHGRIRELQMLRTETNDPFGSIPDFDFEQPVAQSVMVDGIEIKPGSRVRLRPRKGGDIFDLALAGKIAVIERIDQDYEDRIHLAVTIEDDPGRELAGDHVLGHRFFFATDEVEPLEETGE